MSNQSDEEESSYSVVTADDTLDTSDDSDDMSIQTANSSQQGTVSEDSESSGSRSTMSILRSLVREDNGQHAWDPVFRVGVENQSASLEDETDSSTLSATELMNLFEDSTMDVFDEEVEPGFNWDDIKDITPIHSTRVDTPAAPRIERQLTTDEADRLLEWGERIRREINAQVVVEDKKSAKKKKKQRIANFIASLDEFEQSLRDNVIDKPWLDRGMPRPLTEKQFTYMYAMLLLHRKQTEKEERKRRPPTRMTEEARIPIRPYRPVRQDVPEGHVYVEPEFRNNRPVRDDEADVMNTLAVFVDPEFQVGDSDPTTQEQREEFVRVMNMFDEAQFVDDRDMPVVLSPPVGRRPLHPLFVQAPVEDEQGVVHNAPWAPGVAETIPRPPRRSVINADVQDLVQRMRNTGLSKMSKPDRVRAGHCAWADGWNRCLETNS